MTANAAAKLGTFDLMLRVTGEARVYAHRALDAEREALYWQTLAEGAADQDEHRRFCEELQAAKRRAADWRNTAIGCAATAGQFAEEAAR